MYFLKASESRSSNEDVVVASSRNPESTLPLGVSDEVYACHVDMERGTLMTGIRILFFRSL